MTCLVSLAFIIPLRKSDNFSPCSDVQISVELITALPFRERYSRLCQVHLTKMLEKALQNRSVKAQSCFTVT